MTLVIAQRHECFRARAERAETQLGRPAILRAYVRVSTASSPPLPAVSAHERPRKP